MAEKQIKVIGAAVVLPQVGGSERYLYRHAVAPAKAFTPEGLEHAKSIGLIEDFEPEDDSVEIPEGDPTADWKVDQLKAYAEAKSIDLGGATKKDDILAVLVPAK